MSSQRRLCKLKVSNKSFVVLSYLPRVCYKAHIPYSASFTLLKLLCLKFIIFSRVPTLFSFIPLAIKIACLYWADEQTFSFIKVVLYLIKSLDFQLVHYLTKIFISTSLTYILHSMVRQAVLGSLEKTSAQFILERAFCCGGYNIVLVYIPRYVTFKYGSIILVHPTINFSIPLVEKTWNNKQIFYHQCFFYYIWITNESTPYSFPSISSKKWKNVSVTWDSYNKTK